MRDSVFTAVVILALVSIFFIQIAAGQESSDSENDKKEDFGHDAVFLIIDEDSVDNGLPPNFFSDTDINDDIAEIGLRTQLRFFAANVGNTITLHTGQVGDEAWFALKTIPDSWKNAGPTSDGLRNYILAGPGLGSGSDPEKHLDKIANVTPLRATGLKLLEGQQVCAVVYDSDISITYDPLDGSLKGANLGIIAFEVKLGGVTQLTGFSSSTLPQVDLTILDAPDVCAGTLELFTEAPVPISSSEPFDVVPGETFTVTLEDSVSLQDDVTASKQVPPKELTVTLEDSVSLQDDVTASKNPSTFTVTLEDSVSLQDDVTASKQVPPKELTVNLEDSV